jgi:hypothetical protein
MRVRRSQLVSEAQRIETAIDAHCNSGPGLHKRRQSLRRELLRVLVTPHEEPEGLHAISVRTKPLKLKLNARLERLACAIYLWKQHRVSKSRAARLAVVPEVDIDYVESLAGSTKDSLAELTRTFAPKVRADVDAHLERLSVTLDQRAIEDILLAAAESYAVKAGGPGRKYTEIYGLCFGTRKETPPNGSPEFGRILNVTRIITQMRARAGASEVTPNDHSAKVHRQVAERFFPNLELLGDYHTHPFPDLTALKERRGWSYSPSDQTSIVPWLEETRAEGSDPRFSLILAIARGGKVGRRAKRLAPNRIQLTIDDYFFILSAYRIRKDDLYDSRIGLGCPQVSDWP